MRKHRVHADSEMPSSISAGTSARGITSMKSVRLQSPWCSGTSNRHGLQVAGIVDVFGFVQSGPSPVVASGRLMNASGPA